MNTTNMSTTELQQKLLGLGFYKNVVDGIYGEDTITAVKELQKTLSEYGLYNFTVDGKFGSLTKTGLLTYIDTLVKQNAGDDLNVNTTSKIDYSKIIYSTVLSNEFIDSVWWMAEQLRHPLVSTLDLTNDFIGCMAWESAETFSPSIKNAAGSGAQPPARAPLPSRTRQGARGQKRPRPDRRAPRRRGPRSIRSRHNAPARRSRTYRRARRRRRPARGRRSAPARAPSRR